MLVGGSTTGSQVSIFFQVLAQVIRCRRSSFFGKPVHASGKTFHSSTFKQLPVHQYRLCQSGISLQRVQCLSAMIRIIPVKRSSVPHIKGFHQILRRTHSRITAFITHREVSPFKTIIHSVPPAEDKIRRFRIVNHLFILLFLVNVQVYHRFSGFGSLQPFFPVIRCI